MTESQYLKEFVSQVYGIAPADFLGRSRKPEFCTPRFTYWYLLNEACGWTFLRIGEHSKRHHTTIMSGVKKFKKNGGEKQFDARKIGEMISIQKVKKDYKRGDFPPVDNLGKEAGIYGDNVGKEGIDSKNETKAITP